MRSILLLLLLSAFGLYRFLRFICHHWLDVLTRAWIERDDPNWIYDYSKKVAALTLDDMQQTAKKYFNMDNYIKAVLNPEK